MTRREFNEIKPNDRVINTTCENGAATVKIVRRDWINGKLKTRWIVLEFDEPVKFRGIKDRIPVLAVKYCSHVKKEAAI